MAKGSASRSTLKSNAAPSGAFLDFACACSPSFHIAMLDIIGSNRRKAYVADDIAIGRFINTQHEHQRVYGARFLAEK